MTVQDDVAAARRAVLDLEQACTAVTGHFGDTIDARRLRTDVARLTDDLELLCGSDRAAAPPVPVVVPVAPVSPARMVIADTSYVNDFWMDAEDEGIGGGRRRP